MRLFKTHPNPSNKGAIILEAVTLAISLILFFAILTMLSSWLNQGKILYDKVQGERRILVTKDW